MRTIVRGVMIAGAAVAIAVSTSAVASASTPSVSQTAAAWTPYLVGTDVTVNQLVQCSSTMYAVGAFAQVGAKTQATVTRHNVFSFSATTGKITSWNPNANGAVNAISLSADCSTAYLGGSFSTVNGVAVKNLAKVNATTGAVDTTFKPAPNGAVLALQQAAGRLFVGGQFASIAGTSRAAMATVTLANGTIDNYSSIAVVGNLAQQRAEDLELPAQQRPYEAARQRQLPHRGRPDPTSAVRRRPRLLIGHAGRLVRAGAHARVHVVRTVVRQGNRMVTG